MLLLLILLLLLLLLVCFHKVGPYLCVLLRPKFFDCVDEQQEASTGFSVCTPWAGSVKSAINAELFPCLSKQNPAWHDVPVSVRSSVLPLQLHWLLGTPPARHPPKGSQLIAE